LSPTSETEFEVQAKLFSALKQHGFEVRGEVSWRLKPIGSCRFDIVIYEGGEPARIVEVKSSPVKHRSGTLEDTRQGRRYRLFGVPVTFVYGSADADAFLALMLEERAHV